MMQVPLILSFDTATPNCSVALTRGGPESGTVVAAISVNSGVTHSRRLLGYVDWLLQETGLQMEDVGAVAVGLGPGSFTGLRIGMATAKGLCHGSGKPLIGISSLEAIGRFIVSDKLISVVLDARKKEVYNCFFRYSGGPLAKRCSEPVVVKPETLAENISEPVLMAGDGVTVYRETFSEMLGNKLEVASAREQFPTAEQVGFLAYRNYRKRDFLDLAGSAPCYVRSSDAELSLISPLEKMSAAATTTLNKTKS